MSQPEIFRRCSACGASFSRGAVFCPQCGNATSSATSETEASPQQSSEIPVIDETPYTYVDEAAAREETNIHQTLPLPNPPSSPPRVSTEPQRLNPGAVARQAVDRRRRSEMGPGTSEGRIKPGVDKLRKGTSIVIDEAAYDPSLRFVLIAALLFLLFLVLLFLSKWIN